MPDDAKRELLPGLHGLRAAAALAVIAYHVQVVPPLPVPDALAWARHEFGLGVHLFFVLSAFALAWANPDAARNPAPYLIKRVFRIAPLFYAVWLLMALRHGAPGWGQMWSQALLDLTFTFNLVPGSHHSRVLAGWTVGTEMAFYAVLPLLLLLRPLWAVAVATAVAIALSLAARRALTQALPGSDYALIALPSNLGVFLAGLLAWRLFVAVCAHGRADGRASARADGRAGAVAALAAAVGLGGLAALLPPFGLGAPRAGQPEVLAYGVAFAALCLWQALRPSWLLANRVALWLGERSYALYLLHLPLVVALRPLYARLGAWVGALIEAPGLAYLACVALTLAALLPLAALAYALIERPGMALGRRLAARVAAGGGASGRVTPPGWS